MMSALCSITVPHPGPQQRAMDDVEKTHGVNARAARMYTRFFGQDHVLMSDETHSEMLLNTLRQLVSAHPELTQTSGIACYTKTQTHNTPTETDWLRGIFDAAGLDQWDVATFSMTNCASALAAVHAFAGQDRPLLVLSGEKAFHSTGNRLSVGLLGEAPAAALFLPQGERQVRFSRVRHAPRYFLNPDDMPEADKKALQSAFEAGFEAFLSECLAAEPDFFAEAPVLVPYNLNVPLVMRVLARLGLEDLVQEGHSGRSGHSFCSDTFLNLVDNPVPRDKPVFLFCAGMGVTYAALALEPRSQSFLNHPTS